MLRLVSLNIPNLALQIWTFPGQILLFQNYFVYCKTHLDKDFCRSYKRSALLVAEASKRKTRISIVSMLGKIGKVYPIGANNLSRIK